MQILNGVVAIVGDSGSGKTEVSINLAIRHKIDNSDVIVADLDLVNPYFRIREARNILSSYGVKSILPDKKYLYADLPILTPIISGAIKSDPNLLILDVGGGSSGSRVLGALSSFFKNKCLQVLWVINPNRPQTKSIKQCLKVCRDIELSSGIKITGIIANPNLMCKTTVEDVKIGYNFVKKLSNILDMSIFYIAVSVNEIKNVKANEFDCEILPIERYLTFPWKCS